MTFELGTVIFGCIAATLVLAMVISAFVSRLNALFGEDSVFSASDVLRPTAKPSARAAHSESAYAGAQRAATLNTQI